MTQGTATAAPAPAPAQVSAEVTAATDASSRPLAGIRGLGGRAASAADDGVLRARRGQTKRPRGSGKSTRSCLC